MTTNLKDNLGRPLSEIYLTIIKNNIGYKQWYEEHDCGSPDVEFSHCFGKLNCAFKLSNYAVPFNEYVNVTTINSLESVGYAKKGLDIDNINENSDASKIDLSKLEDLMEQLVKAIHGVVEDVDGELLKS